MLMLFFVKQERKTKNNYRSEIFNIEKNLTFLNVLIKNNNISSSYLHDATYLLIDKYCFIIVFV